ncbi:RHS repeat-associated core domain-containing protein [Xanthomonas sp. WHRI 7945]
MVSLLLTQSGLSLPRSHIRVPFKESTAPDAIYPVRTDHLGRPEFATDGSAQVVWKAYNYAYGRSVTQDQTGGIRLGLHGQYFDSESGLWYNGYRDYDPVIGRYLQSDPLGLAGGGMNTYDYVSGNPISFVDPLGLTQCDIDAAFAFAKKMNPDIKFGAGAPKADIPRDGVEGKAELRGGDGYIHLNERYLNVLDWSGVYNLLDTMIHEGLHFTRPIG